MPGLKVIILRCQPWERHKTPFTWNSRRLTSAGAWELYVLCIIKSFLNLTMNIESKNTFDDRTSVASCRINTFYREICLVCMVCLLPTLLLPLFSLLISLKKTKQTKKTPKTKTKKQNQKNYWGILYTSWQMNMNLKAENKEDCLHVSDCLHDSTDGTELGGSLCKRRKMATGLVSLGAYALSIACLHGPRQMWALSLQLDNDVVNFRGSHSWIREKKLYVSAWHAAGNTSTKSAISADILEK